MSMPIETNTEELQDIVNYVYNLPNIGGKSSQPDLVIGLNVENTKVCPDDSSTPNRNFFDMTEEDIVVLQGSVSTVADKINQGLPVKIALKVVHFYWSNSWFRSVAESSHALVVNSNVEYPSENSQYLSIAFFVSEFGFVAPAHPLLVHISFNVETGAVHAYQVYEMVTAS